MPITYCVHDSAEGIERLKRGDEQAWCEIISCYSNRLRSDIFVSLIKRSLPDCSVQDIEQETYIIALNKIRNGQFVWRREGSLYNWMRAISVNRILSRVPHYVAYNDTLYFEEIDKLEYDNGFWLDRFLQDHGLTHDDPEHCAISNQEKADIWQILLMGENPDYIEIMIQRWIEGKKPQELAECYGMKPSSISQILWRMKKQMELLLDSTGQFV